MSILSLPAWYEQWVRGMADSYGCTLAEARRQYPREGREGDWLDYVREAWEGGDDLPTRVLRALPDRWIAQLTRSTRALRCDADARVLIDERVRREDRPAQPIYVRGRI